MPAHQVRSPLARVGAIVSLTIAALVGASASGLGLSSTSLYTDAQSGLKAAPTRVTCDNFTGNGTMSNRAVSASSRCGASRWTIHTGSATTNGGQARPNGTNATITIAAGAQDRIVQATVSNAGGGSDVAGLALAHNGTSILPRYLGVALVGSSTVQLRMSNGITVSTLSSASATITANTVLRARLSGGVVTVWVNGSQRISYTLSALQRTTISGGTRYGIYDSGGSGRYDDFLVTEVWP